MAHKWKDIRKPPSPEARERIQRYVKEAASVMTLHQLREDRSLPPRSLVWTLLWKTLSRGSLCYPRRNRNIPNTLGPKNKCLFYPAQPAIL